MKKFAEAYNILYSKQRVQIKSGNMTLGTSVDNNSNLKNIYSGSACTQGSGVRDLSNLVPGTNLFIEPTEEDVLTIIGNNIEIFEKYENLVDYPWLTSLPAGSNDTDYKIFGKGYGTVEWYNLANENPGNPESTYEQNNFYWYLGIPTQIKAKNINNLVYPFSGTMNSGTLVQLQFESNSVKIVPYQAGRGVPQLNPEDPYFSGNAYGSVLWTNGETIEPVLSMGAVPGNNDFPIGISIDTEGDNTMYKYEVEKEHPGPFTKEFQAPWYRSYISNDPVPILSKGITTVPIGAAYNIGMQSYYVPDVAEGDNPVNNLNYVSIPVVPLFEGEVLEIGSQVYSTVMGHVITPNQIGKSPYPPATAYDILPKAAASGVRFAQIENPWYDWYDPTYGAVGWTGTPNFLLQNIPERGTEIIETRNNKTLDFLIQANQGTIIVQPKTLDVAISGRMELIGKPTYDSDGRLSKFPGAPERAQPFGTTLERVEGKGRWIYSGNTEIIQPINSVGSGYSTSRNVKGYNVTQNSLLLSAKSNLNGYIDSLRPVDNIVPGYSTLNDFSKYPVGTIFTIFNNGVFGGLYYVLSNNGTSTVTFSIIQAGYGFPKTDEYNFYVTEKISNEAATFDIIASNGELLTVKLRFPGSGNIEGDIISIGPEFTGNVTLSYEEAVPSLMRVYGGYGYQKETDSPISMNNVNIIPMYEATFENKTTNYPESGSLDRNGTVSNFNIVDTNPLFPVKSLDILSVNQTTNDIFNNQSQDGTEPLSTWPSYTKGYGLNFIQMAPYMEIVDPGSDYIPGNYEGTYQLQFNITLVGPLGEILSVIKVSSTENIPLDSTYTVGTSGLLKLDSNYDVIIVEPGTGFSPGLIYGTSSQKITVNVTYVDPTTKGILSVNKSVTEYKNLPLDIIFSVSGGTGGTVRLRGLQYSPVIVNKGTGYITEENVTLRNLSLNSLFVMGEVNFPNVGNCRVQNYSLSGPPNGTIMPFTTTKGLTIDLSRYEIGDIITVLGQCLTNAKFEISSMSVPTNTLLVSQIDNGTGYPTPTTEDFAYFETILTDVPQITANIVAKDGNIVTADLNIPNGTRVKWGDFLLVESGDRNCILRYIPKTAVPPQWLSETHLQTAVASDWNNYANMMKSSVNLFGYPLLLNIGQDYPNYYNNSWYFYGDGGYTGDTSLS